MLCSSPRDEALATTWEITIKELNYKFSTVGKTFKSLLLGFTGVLKKTLKLAEGYCPEGWPVNPNNNLQPTSNYSS